MSYQMPLGVPDAWIDPDITAPARPDPWTSEIAGYYYVDWNSGTDSGRTYGDPTAPRKSIPNPVPAGSRVEMAPGDYGGGVQMLLDAEGTSGAWSANVSGPAWLLGASSLTTHMTNQCVFTGSYLYIDGLKWDDVPDHLVQIGRDAVSAPTHHLLFRNCEINGGAQEFAFGMIVSGKDDGTVENTIFYNNSIHSFGDMESETDVDNSVFATGNYIYHLWFIHNLCHTCTAGVRFGAAGGADPSEASELAQFGYIADNEIYNCLAAGLSLKYAKNVVYSSNYVHDIVDTTWSSSKCVGAQYAPNGFWLIFNRFEGNETDDAKHGLYLASTDEDPDPVVQVWPVYVIGNTFAGFRHGAGVYDAQNGNGPAAITLRGSLERYIVNNTIYDSCGGIYTEGSLEDSITKFFGNIISEITEAGSGDNDGKHILYGSGAVPANFQSDYNLCYQAAGDAQYRRNDDSYSGLAAWQAGTPEGDHDVEADPDFTNAGSGDFTLQSGSPAINAGDGTLIDTLEALYFSIFGVSIAFDRNGTPRPYEGSYDIGAYEFIGAVTPSQPGNPATSAMAGMM